MNKDNEQLAPNHVAIQPSAHSHVQTEASPFAEKITQPHKRTLGEKTVDFLVYPFINNFLVIGTSVVATYLTQRGDPVGKEGTLLNKAGKTLRARGEWMEKQFTQKLNMSKSSAEMSNMVFWSFADGTLLTPFVKLLEDRRETMARWVDNNFGSKQTDELVYKTEPKQTWNSVISGRIASLAIVLPTAIALNQKSDGISFNDRLFTKPSTKLAKMLDSKTSITEYLPKLDTKFFSKTLLFEAVYTSICTAGLYFISRHLVKNSKQHKARVEEVKAQQPLPVAADTKVLAHTDIAGEISSTPFPHVSETEHLMRVKTPATQEITA